jgi:hypothetical protein
MRSLSGGIGARGFRIGAPLLSLAATVLPQIGYGRLAPVSTQQVTANAEIGAEAVITHGARARDIYGEEPVRHAGR